MEKFTSALAGSDVVFIVGTGLSAATTGSASTATWTGLIGDGIDRVYQLDPKKNAGWRDLALQTLQFGQASGAEGTSYLISAAGMVSTALTKVGPLEYARWLQESVGALKIVDSEPAKALLSYPFPILTTNYDTLLEQIGGRPSAHWEDAGPFQEVLTRGSGAIGHIHGIWNRPGTVVLTEGDYAKLAKHESTVALERAMSALKSVVYVGFGAGLSDPNFSELLSWHRSALPESPVVHFRLCKLDEEIGIRQAHGNDNVVPVVYGETHAELANFLRQHSPDRSGLVINDVGLARDVIQEARDDLIESMSADSVLLEAGVDRHQLPNLIVPPVLLPMQYSLYMRERAERTEQSGIAPYDPQEEVSAHDLIVVVGEDGSGVSTTVKWLACEASKFLGPAAPIYINFGQCRGKRPMTAAVAQAAIQIGLIRDRRTEIPAHVLAIDDYDPGVGSLADTFLGEFIQSAAIVKIVGCKQGSEEELVTRLRSAGLRPRVHYLGRMRAEDVRSLADIVSPGRGHKIAKEVAKVLTGEGLNRTPLTVSILIYLVHRGVSDPGSQSSIIDSYVHLLLITGDPHLPRPSLSEGDLEAILANLAEYMTWQERTLISENEAVTKISGAIAKYGWPAQAIEVLAYLRARRVLRVEAGRVSFVRTAYFFAFAARRAFNDQQFHELLTDDPFYYEPVITRYAALSRSDSSLLQAVAHVVGEALKESVLAQTPYETLEITEIEEELALTEASADAGIDLIPTEAVDETNPPVDDAGAGSVEVKVETDSQGPYSNRSGSVSFGLDPAKMSVADRTRRTVRLASMVLRDLDQVEELQAKENLLVEVLELWGRYITALDADDFTEELRKSFAAIAAERMKNRKRYEAAADYFSRSFPAAAVLGQMDAALVSSKLVPIFQQALMKGLLGQSSERVTAAVFFLMLQKPVGWARSVSGLLSNVEPTWLMTEFVHNHCWWAYVRGLQADLDLAALCSQLEKMDKNFSTPKSMGGHMSRYERALSMARATHQAKLTNA